MSSDKAARTQAGLHFALRAKCPILKPLNQFRLRWDDPILTVKRGIFLWA